MNIGVKMKEIIDKAKQILSEKNRIIIAIDGYCASGKTTLAAHLTEVFDAQVIHMDDFFLTPDMRTEKRLSQAGGNVHYERFCNEVVTGIKSGKSFKYNIYSCCTGDYRESAIIMPDKNIIIEGSYSLHPEIPDIYDLKIFLETDYETQIERILLRNGEDALETFKSKWIPLENRYFEEFKIKEKCDITIKTDQKA